jgi:hypothetical protein
MTKVSLCGAITSIWKFILVVGSWAIRGLSTEVRSKHT